MSDIQNRPLSHAKTVEFRAPVTRWSYADLFHEVADWLDDTEAVPIAFQIHWSEGEDMMVLRLTAEDVS